MFGFLVDVPIESLASGTHEVTPTRKTTKRGSYTINTAGDTLHQASPNATRLIVQIIGPDKKLIKPEQIALLADSGRAMEPVHREDRRTGHDENTGLPIFLAPAADTTGHGDIGVGIGINLNKIFGLKGDYAYTEVDWPKSVFTSEKRLQMTAGGQTFVITVVSLGK